MTDAERVIAIARRTIGNPAKQAAKAAQDAAIGRLAAALHRGESPETMERLRSEADVAKAEYLRLLRAKD